MVAQVDEPTRNAMGDALIAQIGGGGKLRIIGGAKPASAAAAQTGTTLSEHTLNTPFAPACAAGVISPNIPGNVDAVAGGTATHYRLLTSGGTSKFQNDVVTSGSGMVLNPPSNVITIGQPVQVNAWQITMPGA